MIFLGHSIIAFDRIRVSVVLLPTPDRICSYRLHESLRRSSDDSMIANTRAFEALIDPPVPADLDTNLNFAFQSRWTPQPQMIIEFDIIYPLPPDLRLCVSRRKLVLEEQRNVQTEEIECVNISLDFLWAFTLPRATWTGTSKSFTTHSFKFTTVEVPRPNRGFSWEYVLYTVRCAREGDSKESTGAVRLMRFHEAEVNDPRVWSFCPASGRHVSIRPLATRATELGDVYVLATYVRYGGTVISRSS